MNANITTESQARLKNPYVGPRPFQIGERLPNRQDQARELSDLVIAERVVLLHSPSGAGKTSLIHAAVLPVLKGEGFRPVGPVRVDKPAPNGNIRNRYVYSIAQYLCGDSRGDSGKLGQLPLDQVLSEFAADQESESGQPSRETGRADSPPVLIIDQFEEILILDPTDWEVKEQFFDDLREVLARKPWWVLLAMREDYMGGLDRYLDLIPGHLRTTYRLDFLTFPEADAAVKAPAESMGVHFEDEAAQLLIDKVARIQVDTPDQKPSWLSTPYVESFQLQVACHRLWKQVRAARQGEFSTISRDDVENLDLDRALSRYYADSVREVARTTQVAEGAIREWFETELITPQRFRSQTVRGPVPGNPDVVRQLQAAYLIRGDSRGGTTWHELAHDRLVGAVLNSNEEWRRGTYEPWQISAYRWRHNDRARSLFLSNLELRYAPAPWSRNLTSEERDFLRESRDAAYKESLLKRHRNVTGLVTAIALIELVVIVLLWLRPF